MRTIIFVFLFSVTLHSFGQGHPFRDSLEFFKRTRTKRIDIEMIFNGSALKHITGYFDKNKSSVIWCSAMIGQEPNCGDTVYFNTQYRDTILKNGTIRKFYFDKFQRLTKSIEEQPKQKGGREIATTEYFYTDSISKRLKKISYLVGDSQDGGISYFYEGPKLIRTEEYQNLRNGKTEHKIITSHLFEYYNDLRVKKATRTSWEGQTLILEFTYTDE